MFLAFLSATMYLALIIWMTFIKKSQDTESLQRSCVLSVLFWILDEVKDFKSDSVKLFNYSNVVC